MGQSRRHDEGEGIGSEYSDLLEAAGVDTVKELKTRKATPIARQACRDQHPETPRAQASDGGDGAIVDRIGRKARSGGEVEVISLQSSVLSKNR